jgi:Kdo2-lipid IVA lauroyltransferase/acyltransferase
MDLRRRLLTAFCDALGALAADTGDRIGASLGLLAYHLGVRRRVVARNVALTLAPRPRERRRLIRRAYLSMGANFVVVWSIGRARGPERCLADAAPTWHRALQARHGGLVYIGPHLGNWEVGAYGNRDADGEICAYAKTQHDGVIDELINRQRRRAGVRVLVAGDRDRAQAVIALRGLRDGRSLGMMADQKPNAAEGVPGWFLGQPTLCHRGAAFFAKRAGAPLVPSFCVRVAAGRYRLFVGRGIAADAIDEPALVQHGMDLMSAIVAAFPGQYFWHHNRFKRASAPLPPRASHPWLERGLRLLTDVPATLRRS